MLNKSKLWPEFPKVVVVDDQIIIQYEDGTKQFWGVEESEDERSLIVDDIQEGLRAIHYLTNCLNNTIGGCFEALEKKGHSKDETEEYLNEAIRNVLKTRCIKKPLKMKPRDDLKDLFYIH